MAGSGGQGGLQPSAAGAPAAAGNGDSRGTAEHDPELASSLIDLTLGILFGAGDATAQATRGVLQGAATAGGFTASLVSGVLESLTTAGICAAEPAQCEQVCSMIRKDCESCAHDATCRDEARAMCGDETANCVEQRMKH